MPPLLTDQELRTVCLNRLTPKEHQKAQQFLDSHEFVCPRCGDHKDWDAGRGFVNMASMVGDGETVRPQMASADRNAVYLCLRCRPIDQPPAKMYVAAFKKLGITLGDSFGPQN